MKAFIHVNQNTIRSNVKNGTDNPSITVKTYRSNEYVREVIFNGPSKLVSSLSKPLSCGARIWIQAQYESLTLIKE